MLLCACSLDLRPPESSQPNLGISNGTTLTVTLVVNGLVVRSVPPGSYTDAIPADALPALPWAVEARSPSGHVLTSMTVEAGDVHRTTAPDGSTQHRGVGNRIDLSCGRLDIWSGPPLLGPMPGPGVPGDCAP